MTDTVLLKKTIEEAGFKLKHIAALCGLSYQGFLNKMNNRYEFNQTEISTLKKVLKLSQDLADLIFFADAVDKSSTD